jgi:hypothetical protein
MYNPMQTTIQHLFQVTALEDVPRERLESFVEEYPFFGYGHYLLSRKLQTTAAGEFTGTTAKTSLYFSNPFWLEWLLVNAPKAAEAEGRKKAAPVTEIEAPLPEPESLPERGDKDIWSTREILVEVEAPLPDTEPSEAAAGLAEGQPVEPSAIEAQDAVSAEEVVLQSAHQQLLNSIEEARLLRESLIKINEDFHTNILPADEPIRDEEPPFVLEEQEQVTAPAEEVSVPEYAFALAEEIPVPEQTIAPVEEISAPEEEPATVPHAEASAPTPAAAPVVTAEPVLTFEPYHTIDYFASQGIRLKLDENPTDQLGKQLKSFTDWLKVMRRLPQKEKGIVPDRVAEQAVQSFAAHSIEGKEVLTETMAEVLAMQGMPERARLVYEKLSLLNPGKSAYFAAKIEQLNSH